MREDQAKTISPIYFLESKARSQMNKHAIGLVVILLAIFLQVSGVTSIAGFHTDIAQVFAYKVQERMAYATIVGLLVVGVDCSILAILIGVLSKNVWVSRIGAVAMMVAVISVVVACTQFSIFSSPGLAVAFFLVGGVLVSLK